MRSKVSGYQPAVRPACRIAAAKASGTENRALRSEDVNEETGKIILTVSEDADCSRASGSGRDGLQLATRVLSPILSLYSGKTYEAIEVDCWATGDCVCRFHAEIKDQKTGRRKTIRSFVYG